MISSVGAFVFGFAQVFFLYVLIQGIRHGQKAADRSWEGAHGLEWTLSSPAPYHSFTTPSVVTEEEAHG